jgi:hypothetical protein
LLLGQSELSPEHQAKNGRQLAFHCNVSAVARHQWQQRRG